MRHLFYILFFFVIFSSAKAQDARDNIIGIYNVKVQADQTGSIFWDTLIISKHPTDISQIYIYYTQTSGSGDYYVFDSINKTFNEPAWPSLEYGSFYANDSIFIHRHLFNSSAPFYYEYWGFKLTTGIEEKMVLEDNFSIYPNPVVGLLNILVKKPVGNTSIKVFDVFGKIIYSTTVWVHNQEQTVTINTENFAKGVYFLLLENEKNSTIKKVVVQ